MIASRIAPKVLKSANTIVKRQMTAISGPPKVRMGFAEKAAHGTVIAVSVLAIPAWVLIHIREYRGLA